MLLRRLSQHLKQQNWFAVALDFFIVVVGILIAFKITSWNEARQDDLIYQQARASVVEEAKMNLILATDFTEQTLAYQATAKEIIQALESCSDDAESGNRLLSAVETMKFYPGVDVHQGATNLMLTSDAFLDNLTPTDRALLSDYARKIDNVAENVRMDYALQLDKDSVADIPVFTRSSTVDWGNGFMGYSLSSSFSEACTDRTLSRYLFDRYQHATYELLQAQRLAEASSEVLIALGEGI
jgi:hypothetical protein